VIGLGACAIRCRRRWRSNRTNRIPLGGAAAPGSHPCHQNPPARATGSMATASSAAADSVKESKRACFPPGPPCGKGCPRRLPARWRGDVRRSLPPDWDGRLQGRDALVCSGSSLNGEVVSKHYSVVVSSRNRSISFFGINKWRSALDECSNPRDTSRRTLFSETPRISCRFPHTERQPSGRSGEVVAGVWLAVAMFQGLAAEKLKRA
jgi:hypothetical protein